MNSYITQNQALLSDPYLSQFGDLIYTTFNKYFAVGPDKREAVAACDISLSWFLYKKVLVENMDFLDHVFLVGLRDDLIFHSGIKDEYMKSLMKVQTAEFNYKQDGSLGNDDVCEDI